MLCKEKKTKQKEEEYTKMLVFQLKEFTCNVNTKKKVCASKQCLYFNTIVLLFCVLSKINFKKRQLLYGLVKIKKCKENFN